jgi:ABC-type antimicrobial peptide transport system permease subunit
MGVRLALGAKRTDIIRLLLSAALAPVTAGILIGLPLALAATRLARGMLFGVTSTDPLTLATVGVILLVTGALAASLPARRAARTDPMVALREE